MSDKKTLIITRHGKSGWDYQNISDIDRPLKERGIINTYEMANLLLNKGIIPGVILSSPASRAIYTAIILMRELAVPDDRFFVKNDMYMAECEDLIKIIKEINDEVKTLLIVGHNPGFTELVNYLSDLNISNLPTAGTAILDFNISSWKDVGRSTFHLGIHEFPGQK